LRHSGKGLEKFFSDVVTVEDFDMDDPALNHIKYQHPRVWFEFYATMTSTVPPLRLSFSVKRRAEVIAASAAVYNLQPGDLSG
jgi:hypothetical protein